VSVAAPTEAAVPVRKLNEIGGEFPTWSASGRAVHWSLGNAVWTYDLDRAKVVEDSLKAAAKAAGAPAAPADSAARAAAARRDSLAKAAAYKPAEVRVSVGAARDIPRAVHALNAPIIHFDPRGVAQDPWTGDPLPGAEDSTIESMVRPFIGQGVRAGTQGDQMQDFIRDFVGFFITYLKL
jgi:hypothetical protein